MSIERDALFTAYALGELEGPEREAIEAELAQSPERRAWVEEVQALATMLEAEGLPEEELTLSTHQHAEIDAKLSSAPSHEQIEGTAQTHHTTSQVSQTEPAIGEPDPTEGNALNDPGVDDPRPDHTKPWLWLGGVMGVLLAGLMSTSYFMLEGDTAYQPKGHHFALRSRPMAPAWRYQNGQPLPSAVPAPSKLQAPTDMKTARQDPSSGMDKLNSTVRLRLGQNLDKEEKANLLNKGFRTKSRLTLLQGQKGKGDGDGKRYDDTGKDGQGKKKKAQVWQRSKSNTVLSKVWVGGKSYLVLKKMRVTVQIEGIRARTVIDHIYYNPHHRQLQGTFKYTLPPRSSVSYYAMFVGRQRRTPRFFGGKLSGQDLLRLPPHKMARKVQKASWGKLREARLVAAVKGRQVYEDITRRRIDPALLEQDAPNTFKGRVFPIPARGYNRVIIAYEQTLPQLRGEYVYRFRFPQQVADAIDFAIEYDKSLATLQRSNLRKLRCKTPGNAPYMRCYWEQNKPDRDAIFYFKPKNPRISLVAGGDPVDQRKYLMARVRVQLPKAKGGFGASHGLFALDTSLSANPDLFAAHVRLLMAILRRNQAQLTRFNVLLFDAGARWYQPKGWVANTASMRRKLRQRLGQIVLEGATSTDAALRALARPSWTIKKGRPVDIFVFSDGQSNWGQDQLAASLGHFRKHRAFGKVRFFTYQMGIGSENSAFSMQLAREGGAFFSCLGQAEIPRCAVAHTRPSMQLEQIQLQGIGASELLVEGRQVNLYPDSLLSFAARWKRAGQATLLLKGSYLGKPITLRQSFPVTDNGELAPRAWAEIAVAQLSELNDDKLTPLIVAYSQHFRIPNKHCSFLVLETDKEYKQYGLTRWKREKQVSDVAQWLREQRKRLGTTHDPKAPWQALLRRASKRAGILQKSAGRTIFSILRRLPADQFTFSTPQSKRLWLKGNVPSRYLKQRLRDRNNFDAFVAEAKRRLQRDVPGAVRALSSIVELHPGNPQALRLVGYYLTGWKRPVEAAQIFFRVLQRRPFEPHSYRDLAKSLAQLQRYPLAAVLYELILARRWHSRFGQINTIAREEYALLLQEALNSDGMKPSIRGTLRRRQAMLGLYVKPARLRVTVTWNTDSTDIDLWVTEPNGQKCYYRQRHTRHGGALLQDITRGYGPERYQNTNGKSGEYKVQLQYYGHSTNTLGNETHARITIVIDAGRKGQQIIEHSVVLKRRKQIVTVAKLKL